MYVLAKLPPADASCQYHMLTALTCQQVQQQQGKHDYTISFACSFRAALGAELGGVISNLKDGSAELDAQRMARGYFSAATQQEVEEGKRIYQAYKDFVQDENGCM